jgi:hypothetical protein
MAGLIGGSDTVAGMFRRFDLGQRQTLARWPTATQRVRRNVPQSKLGRTAFGRSDRRGTYALETSKNISDVFPGKYRVKITTRDLARVDANGREVYSPERVPTKYNKHSDVLRTVKPGSNQFDFEMTSESD